MTYSNTPNNGDTLGSTRVPINTNFSLIQSTMSRDHIGMGIADAGDHKVIHLQEQASEGQTTATETAIYNVTGGNGDLFVRSPNHVDVLPNGNYQLTTFSDGDITEFGTNVLVGLDNSGWTFLPGGLVIQYGLEAFIAPGTQPITFPVTLNIGAFAPVITTGSSGTGAVTTDIPITTGFNLTSASSGNVKWMCIGKK